MFERILIVGCGNMAGAMLRGWLRAGFQADRFAIVDPAGVPFGGVIRGFTEVPQTGHFDLILLGTKPQQFGEVAHAVEPLAGPDSAIASILAGVDLDTLAAAFPRAAGWFRIMPNLAAELGKSPLGLAERGLGAQGRLAALDLLAPLGRPEWIDEVQFDLVTALAGSGPAFVYRFIDALAAAAAELGLPAEQAARLALAMVAGSAALAEQGDAEPAELARRVTSKGGTTAAGLAVLDADGALVGLLRETLRAARDRGGELAADARRQG